MNRFRRLSEKPEERGVILFIILGCCLVVANLAKYGEI